MSNYYKTRIALILTSICTEHIAILDAKNFAPPPLMVSIKICF